MLEYDDIQRYKRLNLVEIIEDYGCKVKKTGTTYKANCPFHDDKDPSLVISQKGEIWLWRCFGCNKGGTVIDFVMRMENTTLKETYQILREKYGTTSPQVKKDAVNSYELLKKVTDFYHKTFKEDQKARDYLEKRGIKGSEIIDTFKIGYANGTLKRTLPMRGAMIKNLKEIGILTEKGTEFFYNCVVIPMYDEDGNVVSLYGRNLSTKKHLYIKGTHKGLVNRQGAYGAEKLILTESIIDAISLYQMGVRNVIPCYGTNGLTEDHKRLIEKEQIKEIDLAYDNDEAGISGAKTISEKLPSLVEKVNLIKLPEDIKDINDLLISGKPYNSLPAEEIKTSNYKIERVPGLIHIKRDSIDYRIRTAVGEYIKSMKVNIRLSKGEDYTIDVVDLYSQRSRKSYAKRISERFYEDTETIAKDLYKIIDELEKTTEEPQHTEGTSEPMTEADQEEALKTLKDKDLIKRIIDDLGVIGCVGENMNKLLGYIVTVSRKLEEPLSMIIVSQSGAGKSNLADLLESIVPEEDCVHLSRLTPQALYYMAKDSLSRKVLVIEEKEGSEAADYSIRVLQSKQVLRTAVPVKDPRNGRMKTEVIEVSGQVTVIETTTRTDLNPENTSRCFIVYMDESEEQTRRIHYYQKKRKTIFGIEDSEEKESIIRKHQNMQRLLGNIRVHNPYVEEIEFPTKWLRVRRDHMRFLNLIEAVTFLHQKQREKKITETGIEYIESTVEDYDIAYDMANDIIGDSLTELMKPERDFLKRIEEMLKEKNKDKFTRRQLREYLGLPDHIVRKYITKLVELEYLQIIEGKKGQKYEYKLHEESQVAEKIIKGLTTPEELREKLNKQKP